jgi:hypothetical protein
MGYTITVDGHEPLPTGKYRVLLTAISRVETPRGYEMKWVFIVLVDNPAVLVAYTPLSTSLGSKCMRWVSALLNRSLHYGEEVDLTTLVGRTAIADVVYHKQNGEEYNEVEELYPEPQAP